MLPKTKIGRTVIENFPPSNSESGVDLRLPQDLITEILLYLPVKPLVKFKCVSKSWMCLISSPEFIKSHFTTSSREGQYSDHLLLFTTLAPNYGMKYCSLSAALRNPSTNVSVIEYPSPNPKKSLKIVGIVNGLVCLAIDGNDLYLWNPNLRKSKHLPNSSFILKDGRSYFVHGFGYNESNDDYKVVILRCVYRIGRDHETQMEVYSLRADLWRRTEDFKGVVPFLDGAYANGKIWWTASKRAGGKWKFVSLDMVNDKYEEMQGPCYEDGAYYCGISLLDGCLSMLCDYYKTKVDIWVMDKNGVEKTWSKLFTLRYDDVHPPVERSFSKKGFCILRDGEIVLEDKSGLIVCRTKNNRNIRLEGLGLYYGFSVYVESLVPL